uniref:peptidylprolyl isomerase n=1 Tax=Alexandrium monilatum TaxID=311494 RepID=A0A7S4ST94_9DINO
MDLGGAGPQLGQERPGLSRNSRVGSGTRFSGAPLWRFTLRKEEQRRLQEEENKQQVAPPDGFVWHSDGWYFNPQQKVFWQLGTQKYFLYSEASKQYTEIRQAASIEKEFRVSVDASCLHRPGCPREDRHVIIRDLAKAAQALRMPIDHLPRPAALFAVYSGHRPVVSTATGGADHSQGSAGSTEGTEDPAPPTCAEFVARNLHRKLLPRLSEFKGPWGDSQIASALRESCNDLDAEFLSKGNASDGCSAVIAMFLGQRLFITNLGDAAALLGEKAEDGRLLLSRRTPTHSPAMPAERSRIRAIDGTVVEHGPQGRPALRGEAGELLHLSRSFGDRAFKAGESKGADVGLTLAQPQQRRVAAVPIALPGGPEGAEAPLVLATPDVDTVVLHERHLFLAIVGGEIAHALSQEDIADLLRRHLGRPRVASGALLQEAQVRGASGSLTVLCAFFEWGQEAARPAPEPAAKRPKAESATQVRCRQILVKHKDSKEPVDRVRNNQQITRSLADAERILRDSLEAIQSDPERSIFTQRCKAVSECSTCLKGGEMAGDLGWVSRGQVHPNVEAAVFALPVGHISDIIESDEGVHVLWRIA